MCLRTRDFLKVMENIWQLTSRSLLPPNHHKRPQNMCPFLFHSQCYTGAFLSTGCVCGWIALPFKGMSRCVANGNQDPAGLYRSGSESGKCNHFPGGGGGADGRSGPEQPATRIGDNEPPGTIKRPFPQPTHPALKIARSLNGERFQSVGHSYG